MRQTTSRIYRWQFGEAEFDESKWEFRLRGQMLSLEPRPLEVLGLLLRRAGTVVTKEEFHEVVWPGLVPGDKALTNAIGKLRSAVGDENQSVIETIYKVGYRLVAPVTHELVRQQSLGRPY